MVVAQTGTPMGHKAHKCPMPHCPRSFDYKFQLKQHLLLEERQFKCRQCKQIFEGRGPLISHLRANDSCKIEHNRLQDISDSQDRSERLRANIYDYEQSLMHFSNLMGKNRESSAQMLKKLTNMIFHVRHLAVLAKTKKKQAVYRKKFTKLKIDFLKDFQNYQNDLKHTSKMVKLVNRNCGVRGCVGKSHFEIDRHRPWYT